MSLSWEGIVDIVIFFLKTLGIWALCVLPGVWLGRRLAAKGITPDQSMPFSIATLWAVLLGRLSNLVPDTWWYYLLSTTFAFLGVYRYEFAGTQHWGRWWWKKETIIRKAEQPLPLLWKIWFALIIVSSALLIIFFVIRLFEAGFRLK